MLCSMCKTGNEPARLYCSSCGNKLSTRRHICGFINNETDNYCGGCGTKLSDSEIKQIDTQFEKSLSATINEIITEDDLINIIDECSQKFIPQKSALSQEEIEKLFKA